MKVMFKNMIWEVSVDRREVNPRERERDKIKFEVILEHPEIEKNIGE